jgi:hypothetical protein
MTTIYINAPFAKPEHDAIAALAKAEGRSKGKQLRELALAAIGANTPKPAPRKPAKKAHR